MKRRVWTLVLNGASGGTRVRTVRIPFAAAVILAVFVSASLGGLARLSFFAGKYFYAEFGLEQLRREHETLLSKLRFLNRLSGEESAKLMTHAVAEDFLRLKYGMNIIGDDVRQAGVGGALDPEALAASLLNVPVVRNADSILLEADALLRRARLQNNTLSQALTHARRQRERWAHVPSVWPSRGRVTSRFGQRIHPIMGLTMRHTGMDIANTEWTPVYATADGIAAFVDRKQYYGITVDIDHHSNGYVTRYAHLVQAIVVEGQLVRRGDIIGYMGRTGRTTGPHLHYEVRKLDNPIDPMDYIVPSDIIID